MAVGSILVVDDERSMRDFLRIALQRLDYEVTTAEGPAQAIDILRKRDLDLVLTDLRMQGGTGLDVLDEARKSRPDTEVVVVTAFASTETAIAAIRRGAYDYLQKPFKIDEVTVVLERALEKRRLKRDNLSLRQELEGRYRLSDIVGKSAPMQRLFDLIRKVAPARTSVLINGESGTGKELVARAIHHLSPRQKGPFLGVNCGAIPESLLESELFGYVKGAFTGATQDRRGLFAAAHGGTLFLDEIGELPTAMQVRLLRVLQERKVKPVGGVTEEEYDVRVVAATNRDLEAEVARGSFRQDLYYRLNVIQLELPPLRERREDIPLLTEHFVRKHAAALGRAVNQIEPEALAALCDYDFPGNVRELENLVERAITLGPDDRLARSALPALERTRAPGLVAPTELPATGVDLEQMVNNFERELIQQALNRAAGSRKGAAKLLNISLRQLRYRLAKLGVAAPPDEEEPS